MKRGLWAGFWVIVVVSIGAACFVAMTPKIGHASRAEIEAVLPASLKVQDKPDPAGVERYERLVSVVSGLNFKEPKLGDSAAEQRALEAGNGPMAEVEKILGEGGLRYPERKANMLFRDSPGLKSFAKLIALATRDAVERGDRAAADRYAVLGLRYGAALRKGDGVLIDSLVAIATEAIATKAVYEAEMQNGFDAKGRTAILAMLPAESGPLPELGDSVRRDFQTMFLPLLLDPQGRFEELTLAANGGAVDLDRQQKSLPGTFDPVETAKLAGGIYDATIRDSALPIDRQTRGAQRLAAEARIGLPQKGQGPELWYRMRMNMGRNTIGRTMAAFGGFDQLANLARRRAAERNLVRAVILLRAGQSPQIADPYGKGPLKIDRKRRIVWSLGENGTDDGGDIPTGRLTKGPDQGHRW